MPRPSRQSGKGATFFTIGHSTRPIAAFIALLQEAGIGLVADVRIVPQSRTNPQYSRDALAQALAASQIGYEHIVALGGLRRKRPEAPPSLNAFWQNESFHNYADYAMTEAFRDGLARLQELGRTRTCAIMCAEAVWWRCHRRIVADYLLARGVAVAHIMGPGKHDPASLTPGARPSCGGTILYADPEIRQRKR